MNKMVMNHLDTNIYYDKLSNGLEVYIVPYDNIKGFYVNFVTHFGSNDIEFYSNKQHKMIKVPYGIAHFLEHQTFAMEDGADPFSTFSKLGLDCNANTDYLRTTYLFSGTDNFEDGLNSLLDFVQKPYFSDKNVAKEKGIITEEINMYLDMPYAKLYDQTKYNVFNKHPFKYTTIGTVEDINKINKENLYECYETFYHPSNMSLIITGNIDPKKTIEIIKENQSKKVFENNITIKRNEYKEVETVFKENETLKMSIVIPKVAITYKINTDSFRNINKRLLNLYVSFYIHMNFGSTSLLVDKMVKEGIISDSLDYSVVLVDKYFMVSIIGETNKIEDFKKKIYEQIDIVAINEGDLKRIIKVSLSNLVYLSDNYYQINNYLVNQLAKFGSIDNDIYSLIQNIDFEEFSKIIKKLDFKNKTELVIIDK